MSVRALGKRHKWALDLANKYAYITYINLVLPITFMYVVLKITGESHKEIAGYDVSFLYTTVA